MFKFLHAADIHLDSPLAGLERYEGAPIEAIRTASRRALENMVQLAIDEAVRFVVIAGDLYDGDWPDYNTGLFFVRQMHVLKEAGIPVYLIAGNHDAANRMTRSLKLPDNVRQLSHRAPQTVEAGGGEAIIHGQGFASRAVEDNLAAAFPRATAGIFNLGLLHTCATGDDGHEPYAPCSIDDLESRGYDYWALGHIHKRQRLGCEVPAMFPGNLQGRHIRETGPKGCLVVSVDDRGQAEPHFHALDVMRWSLCELDAREAARGDDVLDLLAQALRAQIADAGGNPLAVRVEVQGATAAHAQLLGDPGRWINEMRAMAQNVGSGQVWLEKVRLRTSPRPTADLPADGPIAELVQFLDDLQQDDTAVTDLGAEFEDLDRKLPAELKEGLDAIRTDDPAWLREVLQQVQPLLVSRLLTGDARP